MPIYIIKFDTPDGPRYLDYSTICDAPITYGMTLDEYKKYYVIRCGEGEQPTGKKSGWS